MTTREEVKQWSDWDLWDHERPQDEFCYQLCKAYLALLDENERLSESVTDGLKLMASWRCKANDYRTDWKAAEEELNDAKKERAVFRDENERLKKEVAHKDRHLWLVGKMAGENLPPDCTEATEIMAMASEGLEAVNERRLKRQATVVEAAKNYHDDLTVENWEKLSEALAKLDGGDND